jgi:phage/conjugal plasmid C-4 type zinc finger TraR family protein
MPDFCDIGSAMESAARKAAIANAGLKNTSRTSRETCAECGEVIPEARRKAIPGVELCIHCQAEQEE